MKNKCKHCNGTGNTNRVDDKTLAKWKSDAIEWATEVKKKLKGQRDLPPGFDPDDKHKYIFRLPE